MFICPEYEKPVAVGTYVLQEPHRKGAGVASLGQEKQEVRTLAKRLPSDRR
jgi:hypothetical protein